MGTKKGIIAGCPISPIIGALYLLPLDRAMQKFADKENIFYLRYMDDYIILAKSRWHLKNAIRKMYEVLSSLKITVHKEKKFIGRIEKGFDFLGYHFKPGCKLKPSTTSMQKFTQNARRLYPSLRSFAATSEQGCSYDRIRLYICKFYRYIHAGLKGLVSRKGGIKRYIVLILKQLKINNILRI